MSLQLILLFGLFLVEHTEGLTCYACTFTYTGTDRDMECVHSPWNVTQGGKETVCGPNQYCTTYRQYDNALNAVRSFARLCGEYDSKGNRCTEDIFGRQDCYTICREDLCNDSDGIPRKPIATPDDSDSTRGRTRPDRLPKWQDDWNRWMHNGADAGSSSSLACVVFLLCLQLYR